MRIAALLAGMCLFVGSGCSRGPALRGTYLNTKSEAALEVTADEIIVKANWVRLGVQYKVVAVDGPDVTVQLSYPKVSAKGRATIKVAGDALVIGGPDAGMLAGTWTRAPF